MPVERRSFGRPYVRARRRAGRRIVALATAAVVLLSVAAPVSAYRRPARTTRVSVTSGEVEGSRRLILGECEHRHGNSDITPDGRYIAFSSIADNLVPGDTNRACDVFVRDLKRGTTTRVSLSDDDRQTSVGGDSCTDAVHPSVQTPFPHAYSPSISSDGRYVAFGSRASDLVVGDTNNDEDIFVRDVVAQTTTRVSVKTDGSQATGNYLMGQRSCAMSHQPSISGNGRYVAFTSYSHGLIAVDENPDADIYVHDRVRSTTTLGSVDWQGRQPTAGEADYPSLSFDGRYLVFETYGKLTDHALPGTSKQQVYRRDLRKKRTALASVSSHGEPGCCGDTRTWAFGGRQISANGRFVVFVANASNLVPNDSLQDGDGVVRTSGNDIFVHDFRTGDTERVSVNSYGEQGSQGITPSFQDGSISANGRYVVFTAGESRQFYPDQRTGSRQNAFLYDRTTGALEWVSATPAGKQSVTGCQGVDPTGFGGLVRVTTGLNTAQLVGSLGAATNNSGRFVAFNSCAADLVPKDTNELLDTFVRDRGTDLGVSGSVGDGGETPASPVCVDGVCLPPTRAATHSDSREDTVPSPVSGADITGVSLVYRPSLGDLFLKMRLESLPYGVAAAGSSQSVLYGATFRVGDTRFQMRAQDVASDDYDHAGGASFGLFRDGGVGWTKVATLRGGFGTTGEAVVVALPLAVLGMDQSPRLSEFEVFTAIGTYLAGPTLTLDSARLGGSPRA